MHERCNVEGTNKNTQQQPSNLTECCSIDRGSCGTLVSFVTTSTPGAPDRQASSPVSLKEISFAPVA